jgi:hypothetical protein
MPKTTFKPKKFRRSKRRYSRLIRRFTVLIGLIAVYFALTTILDYMDPEPVRWARVSFPPFVAQDASYTVNVAYRGLGEKAAINAKMVKRRKDGRSLEDLEAPKPFKVLKQRGHASFVFVPTYFNTLTDFKVIVTCQDNAGQRPAISSGSIPVYSPDHEQVERSKILPDYQIVLIDTFERGYWLADIGDRTVIGWGITVCYLLAGGLCFYCTGYMDSRRVLPISQIFAWFWCFMGVALILLGINKQVDIQMLLADFGRAYTKHHGLYVQRSILQNRVLALGACVGLACAQAIGYRMRGGPKSIWLALWGLLFLGATVLVHLVSLHRIEHALALSVAGLSVGEGLEILAIGWIALSALVYNHTERDEVCYIMQ